MQIKLLFISAIIMAFNIGCKVSGQSEEVENPELNKPGNKYVYSINFQLNGGTWPGKTGGETVAVDQMPGTSVVFPEEPVKTGALFMGWFTEKFEQLDFLENKSADAVALSVDTVFKIKEDDPAVVLKPGEDGNVEAWELPQVYALWKKLDPAKITVVFYNSNGDTEVLTTIGVNEGQAIAAADIPVPSRGTHYDRDGAAWYTAASHADIAFDMNTLLTKSNANPLVLFAKWTGKTYTATFNLNYPASPPPPGSLSLQYPTTPVAAQIPQPARNYYNFDGWWLNQDGSGTKLTTSTVFDGNKTFYAKWTESNEAKKDRTDLGDLTNGIGHELTEGNKEYEDDYIIGSGALAGASNEVQNLLDNLNAKLSNANALLKGTTRTIIAKVDDGTGVIKEKEISVTEYDYTAIKQIAADINTIKSNLIYKQLTNGGIAATQKVITIDKTGQVHSVTIASAGTYQIEAWGASGGHLWSTSNETALGGKGGYVKGAVSLNKGSVLKVRIGGEGVGSSDITIEDGKIVFKANVNKRKNPGLAGGWNGGGKGGDSRGLNYTGGSGGGGATDIRLITGGYIKDVNNKTNGVNAENNGVGLETGSYVDLLPSRIFVAGGGGGAAQSAKYNGSWPGLPGGDAGLNGAPGTRKSGTSTNAARGGTQEQLASIAYDSDSAKTSGTVLGAGGDGADSGSAQEGTGGGGGGYYGGESIQNKSPAAGHGVAYTASGAGGSNFIINTATDTVNSVNPIYGPGKVIISYVGP